MKLLDNGNIYFPDENGNFVSERQRHISQLIRDYDPNLQLQWIPPNMRGPEDKAFRVVDMSPGKPAYVVCFADECDERLLANIFHADQQRSGNNVLTYLDNHNNAVELLQQKMHEEKRMEDHELAYSVLRSTKVHYKHGGIDFGRLR